MEGPTENTSDATKDLPLPSTISDNLTAVNHAQNESIDDHLEGDTIRRQVEYYFSDENLSSDLHMLEKMNYNENRPISIDHICGFKKMRRFKKKALIAAALRRSAFLNVTEDKKLVRKVPFIYVAPTEQEIKTAKVIIEGGRPIAVQDDTVKVANQFLSGITEAPVPGKTVCLTLKKSTQLLMKMNNRRVLLGLKSSTPKHQSRLKSSRTNSVCTTRKFLMSSSFASR